MSFWAEVCVHTAFFITFLTVFYFFFVTFIQTDGLVNDFFTMVKIPLIGASTLFKPDQLQALNIAIGNALTKVGETSPPIDGKNKPIAFYTVLSAGVLSTILLLLGIFLQYRSGGSLYELFLSNLIVIVFIAISEFAIVGLFLKNFIELDQQYIAGIIGLQSSMTTASNSNCIATSSFLDGFLPEFIVNKIYPKTNK